MKVYLYCRVSTDSQDADLQALQAASRFPGAIIRTETASGVKERPVLEALTEELSKGDTLVVAALDRLGRRTIDILSRLELLLERGVRVESLREGPVSAGPTGKLMVTMLSGMAEFERSLIVERTKQALASLKAQGRVLGRPKRKIDLKAILTRLARGHSYRDIAQSLDIPLTTLHRQVKSYKEQA